MSNFERPHHDRRIVGRLEISRRVDDKYLVFYGNAYGTAGIQVVVDNDEKLKEWIEQTLPKLIERNFIVDPRNS